MRTLINAIGTILVLVIFTMANPNGIDVERVNENFVIGLTHDNTGVVESTIKVVILMKIEYPEADYDDIIDELEELIMEGCNKNIRIKALIASDYLNNFEQYDGLKNGKYNDGDQVFDAYINSMSLTEVTNE